MPVISRVRSSHRFVLPAAVVLAACAGATTARMAGPDPRGITAVDGIKVGSVTLSARPTGCTVILVDGEGAVGGVSQRGGAPGTRETDLLDPGNMVDKVNAVVLSGGSAFGLDAATGTVRWLEEHDLGWDVRIAKVPIVPSAILFDLPVGGNPRIRPTADCKPTSSETFFTARKLRITFMPASRLSPENFANGASARYLLSTSAQAMPIIAEPFGA